MPFYRTVTHVGVVEKQADSEPPQRSARVFWRESRRATPRFHPSRGECRHTVLVRWRVPFVVCVGEVASSRAWCMAWSRCMMGAWSMG